MFHTFSPSFMSLCILDRSTQDNALFVTASGQSLLTPTRVRQIVMAIRSDDTYLKQLYALEASARNKIWALQGDLIRMSGFDETDEATALSMNEGLEEMLTILGTTLTKVETLLSANTEEE